MERESRVVRRVREKVKVSLRERGMVTAMELALGKAKAMLKAMEMVKAMEMEMVNYSG